MRAHIPLRQRKVLPPNGTTIKNEKERVESERGERKVNKHFVRAAFINRNHGRLVTDGPDAALGAVPLE